MLTLERWREFPGGWKKQKEKEAKSQINNLSFYLKNLEEEKINPKEVEERK